MSDYTRPAIEFREFRDDSGAVVPYGARWRESPPDDSYYRVSNPERFAPLPMIADALIEHLRDAYRVEVAELATPPAERGRATTKLVAVTPEHAEAAALVFRFTDYPGVQIRAGVRYDAAFPRCGCDACDETCEEAADDMELLVFAVAEGRFVEGITLHGQSGKAMVDATIRAGGRARAGGRYYLEPDEALLDDAARLDRLPGGSWQPWRARKR